ncbi:MAG: hypothetical protein ACLSGN_02510 [Oscillospiraceae bacterium]
MESIVNRIIEIDRNADEKIKAASEKEKQILGEAENECLALKKELLDSAMKKISQIEEFNKKELESESAKLEKRHYEELKFLDDYYNKNHQRIESEIFAEIVGE